MLLQKMLKIDIDGTIVNKHKQVPETFKSNVLTNPARFRNLEKIHNDNKSFLSRLKAVKSSYSTKKWAESRRYSRYLAANISRNAGRVKRRTSSTYVHVLCRLLVLKIRDKGLPIIGWLIVLQ